MQARRNDFHIGVGRGWGRGWGGRLLDEKNFLKMPATTGHWRSKF